MKYDLSTPLSEKGILKLKVGDEVLITGELVTARDRAHVFLSEKKQELPFQLSGGIIFHMGPIAKKENGKWKIVSAGPTTSARAEKYTEAVLKGYGVRAIIGKGGMAGDTGAALKKHKAVYLSAIGGLAAILSQSVEKVLGVYKLEEFGVPEAMWHLRVKDFPAIVTMDAHGNSLHYKVRMKSEERRERLLNPL